MPTQTRTFPFTLNSTSTAVVTEIVHFRDVPLLTGESAAVYLEAMFLNVSLKSFQLMKFPNYEGDESDAERLSLFTAAELASQKIGLRILSRKNNTGAWREKAEIILTNAGRKSYFDLLIPYLAKAQVRLLEYNDALGIQLIDYGNGLLKLTDYIEIECAVSVDIAKKNDDFAELSARIASLELALDGRLTNVPANSLLGKRATAGTIEVIPSSTFATPTQVATAIANLVASSPATLDTLNELATALGNNPNFATTIASSLAVINSQITVINATKSVNVSTPLNIASNTWFTVGTINDVGLASTESVYAISVYIQYGDGTNAWGHWQYHGGGIISSIQWKAGGVQLSSTFKMEAHTNNDFNCSVRFTLSNVNRPIQVMFDVPVITQAPSLLRVVLKRLI